ncbi:MAG: SPOR domain-containing protein [Gammaproteobacteria bacterium]|nr:SPOR domain-containing protein [Gammaproteobacteria bacterium]
MADRDDARPEFSPKHRIVGAIVLVALVVIFVPMILSEREPPAEVKGEREVPASSATTETRVMVSPVPAAEIKPPEAGETAKVVTPAESKPKPESRPAAAKKPEPVPDKSAKPATADKIEDGWMVQVGTFSNTQNATRLRDKLKSLGHSVHTETVTISGKKALRLRVGPFADRERADKAQAQIRKETGIAGVVQTSS